MRDNSVFSEKHCGVTFGFYAKNGYFSSAKAREEVDAMVETGVNWVVLVVTVMQESVFGARQFRDFVNTPNDIELKEIIDYIHSKGIRVQLRPMLECFDGEGRLSVAFLNDRERIPGLRSTHCSRWFESMTARSVYYARIAEITGCEMFCLDSELDRIIRFQDKWKEVIRRVREVYSGPVTSCHTIHTGVIDFEKELENKDHWFYDLDALSISDYIKAGESEGLSAEEMAEYGVDTFSVSRGMVNVMGEIRGVDIWVNFTESDGKVLAELRSSKYNINQIAVKYGGGGHMKASGATLDSRESAMQMLADLDALMEV